MRAISAPLPPPREGEAKAATPSTTPKEADGKATAAAEKRAPPPTKGVQSKEKSDKDKDPGKKAEPAKTEKDKEVPSPPGCTVHCVPACLSSVERLPPGRGLRH